MRKTVKTIPAVISFICAAITRAGGVPMLIGGAVVDSLAGREPRDWDIEVYGLPADALEKAVVEWRPSRCGASHEVLKLSRSACGGVDVDVNMPTTLNGSGLAECDPTLTPDEAALRRDFTMNTLYADPVTGAVFDPTCWGLYDIERGFIRQTTESSFIEDPVRLFRAAQFLSRGKARRETAGLRGYAEAAVEQITWDNLTPERVFGEMQKLLRGRCPSKGLEFLRDVGVVEKLFPELHALVGCKQHPAWHPEGDVWAHTLIAVEMAAALRCLIEKAPEAFESYVPYLPEKEGPGLSDRELETLSWALLCHDLGKPEKSEMGDDGVIRAHGHDQAGEEPTRALLGRLTNDGMVDDVVKLVVLHHRLSDVARNGSDKAWRRLKAKYDPVRLEVGGWLSRCDWASSDLPGARGVNDPGDEHDISRRVWAKAPTIVDRHATDGPKPIITGKDLIQAGMRPGPEFKTALERAMEAQQAGEEGREVLLEIALHGG